MPAQSLQTLSLTSSRQLINEYIRKIERHFLLKEPQDAVLSQDCREAIFKLQEHLRSHIPPSLWETVFQPFIEYHSDVQGGEKYQDIRMLYATYLFDNVYVRKFKMPRILNIKDDLGFWLQCIPMMKHLREVDLKDVTSNEIIQMFAENCVKVQRLTLPLVSYETVEVVIKNCRNLRILDCELDCSREETERLIHNALEQLEDLIHINFHCDVTVLFSKFSHKLKLKRMALNPIDLDGIEFILNQCPDLQHLSLLLTGPHNDVSTRSSGIFDKLAASQLKVSDLSLTNFHIESDAFSKFLNIKGVFLTELAIASSQMNETVTGLLELVSKCKNLSKLCLEDVYGLTQESTPRLPLYSDISLPALSHLAVILRSNGDPVLMRLAKHCLQHLATLKELRLIWNVDDKWEAAALEEVMTEAMSIASILDSGRVPQGVHVMAYVMIMASYS